MKTLQMAMSLPGVKNTGEKILPPDKIFKEWLVMRL